MPPKKLPPRPQQQSTSNSSSNSPNQDTVTANKPVTQTQPAPATRQSQGNGVPPQNAQQLASQQAQISQQEIRQGSATSAQLALDAGKKAYELRQAAYAAGDPDAREEILGKAINKEIEAEAFGKAAKYTRSGAFQGLAAGAGLGIQPGAVIGQVTGAIVGGLLATVGGLLGGGIGSAYGAIKGPIWDIGAMASHGARGVIKDFIGDFPDFGKSTKHQKDMLEKMVLGAKNTPNPSQAELEEMKNDNGGVSREDYQQMAQQMTGYLPSMPSMPDMSKMGQNMSEMPKHLPLVSSLQGLWGQKSDGQAAKVTQNQPVKKTGDTASKAAPVSRPQQSKKSTINQQTTQNESPSSTQSPVPKAKDATRPTEKPTQTQSKPLENKQSPPKSKSETAPQQARSLKQNNSTTSKETSFSKDSSSAKSKPISQQSTSNSNNSESKPTISSSGTPQSTKPTKKAPKLEVRSDKPKPAPSASGTKKGPPKLEHRGKATAASA